MCLGGVAACGGHRARDGRMRALYDEALPPPFPAGTMADIRQTAGTPDGLYNACIEWLSTPNDSPWDASARACSSAQSKRPG